MALATDYTIDDLICTCISRQVEDGEILAQGIATPLVAAGYLLAWHTHAPNVILASAIGNVLCREAVPLGLTYAEDLWLGQALSFLSFAEIACEFLPSLAPKEFFRPAQVDPTGQFNNVVIGTYNHPRLRLPGCGGIADVTVYSPRVYLYVPVHSPSVFVEQLDFVSGVGLPALPAVTRTGRGPGPRLLISDLGVFDFAPGWLRVCSLHPGISLEQVQAATGFALKVAPDLHETKPPTADEVRLLYEEIDPLGIRKLERLSTAHRRHRLRDLVQIEKQGQPWASAEGPNPSRRIGNAGVQQI